MLSTKTSGRASAAPDCGHRCCEIRQNPCHVHPCPPERCERCAASDDEAWGPDGATEIPRIVATVLRAFAPELPHLQAGDGLAERVHAVTLTAYRTALDEPAVRALATPDRRRVVATRVALALAFPS